MKNFVPNAIEDTWPRVLYGVIFIVAGVLHFTLSSIYLKIMPPYLPWHLALVFMSGGAEILGGLGLLIRRTRIWAAWGLVALLIAVMPANVYMATAHIAVPGVMGQSWAQWLRLPLQLPLIWWAWLYTRR